MEAETKMRIVALSDPAALAEHVAAWEDLAAAALEPNPFYEPWSLLPAVRNLELDAGAELQFVLIFAEHVLCGFFPLERQPKIPVNLWKISYCAISTPLLRAACARECLDSFFGWLAENDSVADLTWIPGEGPFYQLLIDCLHDRQTMIGAWDCWTRTCCRRPAPGEPSPILPPTKRNARKIRRLSETGRLEHSIPQPVTDIEGAVQSYLELEALGWKGKEGTALACSEGARKFFVEGMTGAFRANRLLTSALIFEGQAIARAVYFLAKPGCYAFRTTYSEEYAKFSPGLHLMREDLRHLLYERSDIAWLDSGASIYNHPLWVELSNERRTIMRIRFATGKDLRGEFLVAARPLLRWVKRKIWKPAR